MFNGQSSLNGGLGVSRLDHYPLLIVEVGDEVKALLGVALGIQLLSSLKLFKQLLRPLKEIYVHLGLLSYNLAIRAMLLLREVEPDREVKRADLRLHHAGHIHHSSRVLHVEVRLLHEVMHTGITHHHSGIYTSSCSCHHHLLSGASHTHPHVHASSHHHLVVRVPHLCLHRLRLLDDVNRQSEETKLPTKS